MVSILLITTIVHLSVHAPIILRNWASLARHGIEVVVYAEDEQVRNTVRSYDLRARAIGTNRSHYYITYFNKLEGSHATVVGFFNGDNIFDGASLSATIQATYEKTSSLKLHFLLVGRRLNIRPDTECLAKELKKLNDLKESNDVHLHHLSDSADSMTREIAACPSELFMVAAQDYFIFDHAWLNDGMLAKIPESRLGGVIFDNWFTELPHHMKGVVSVDGTDTILDVHLPHGKSSQDSHQSPASAHNTKVHNVGGWLNAYWCGWTVFTEYLTAKIGGELPRDAAHVTVSERHDGNTQSELFGRCFNAEERIPG